MNVFVLNTGRCGSTTFIQACKHITNYSCAHESRSAMLGEERLDYPVNHIEADNRLSWLLGRLDQKYGNDAFYVHLMRNKKDTARSFTKRYSSGIIKAYRGDGILMGLPETIDSMAVSLDYCDTINTNIYLFLKDKSKKIIINLENIDQGFAEFWNLINAEGDLSAALAELKINYNATKLYQEGESNQRRLFQRIAGKLKKVVFMLPGFIKNA
ncbi:hypothetical protein BMS3Abin13_00720 [bacterium BMS3Abin13]|nr:hypothetical protein BMS3Abin13_00720 [bacterium BMS3Abin13]